METIKVNMSPNPLDVQTIHASQNDSEAREWGFELHNNGDVIDSSEISDQLVFKAYKGGTEQLLPENGSTPTTSPIIADIKYPQGLLTDQEFTYRQSPTEEDGLAKITDIKGNTLVWNQQNYDNSTDVSKWLVNDGSKYSVSVSGNVLTLTCTGAPDNNASVRISGVNSIAGHKYLLLSDVKSPKAVAFRYLYSPIASGSLSMNVPANVWTQFCKVVQINSSSGFYLYFNSNNALAQGDVVEIKNHQIIDLTQMFGSTKADEIYAMEQSQSGSGVAYFRSLFPLSYYAYNQGSLLSFNGNGIKTVGKNQLPKAVEGTYTGNGITCVVDEDGTITFSGTATATGNAVIIPLETPYKIQENTYLHLRNNMANLNVAPSFENATNPGGGINRPLSPVNAMVAIGQKANYEITRIRLYITNGTSTNVTIKPMVTFNETESDYEPYTSSTLSLPISTYFPTGMKSAGSVYDELTESKAITRIGSVDLGSLEYTYEPQNTRFYTTQLANVIKKPAPSTLPNIIVPNYTVRDIYSISSQNNMSVGVSSTSGAVFFSNADYTDINAFKTAMNGVYLYYELATPTETSFTTASLVTENAEIPLSNEDGVLIGKCTEQLSENPGFIDAKIKLSDADGECYSNKIQLHVERKPS